MQTIPKNLEYCFLNLRSTIIGNTDYGTTQPYIMKSSAKNVQDSVKRKLKLRSMQLYEST